mmetsp:Transcript_106314/g.227016  ORF Transcript_106314/g.227016 Transcript_106314/m.227016 type:complete len:257 (-) Transcript_106314:938-1708(-)
MHWRSGSVPSLRTTPSRLELWLSGSAVACSLVKRDAMLGCQHLPPATSGWAGLHLSFAVRMTIWWLRMWSASLRAIMSRRWCPSGMGRVLAPSFFLASLLIGQVSMSSAGAVTTASFAFRLMTNSRRIRGVWERRAQGSPDQAIIAVAGICGATRLGSGAALSTTPKETGLQAALPSTWWLCQRKAPSMTRSRQNSFDLLPSFPPTGRLECRASWQCGGCVTQHWSGSMRNGGGSCMTSMVLQWRRSFGMARAVRL